MAVSHFLCHRPQRRTSHLGTHRKPLLEAVEALRRKGGFPLVIVKHRLRQVQPRVNRVLVMREGRIVDDTRETERMLDADWLSRHYVNGGKS